MSASHLLVFKGPATDPQLHKGSDAQLDQKILNSLNFRTLPLMSSVLNQTPPPPLYSGDVFMNDPKTKLTITEFLLIAKTDLRAVVDLSTNSGVLVQSQFGANAKAKK